MSEKIHGVYITVIAVPTEPGRIFLPELAVLGEHSRHLHNAFGFF